MKKQISLMMVLAGMFILQVSMVGRDHDQGHFVRQDMLHEFEGFYRFPNRAAYIQFEVDGDQLQARQVWDGRLYPLIKTGDLTFESIDEQYKVAFDAARPTSVLILDRVTLTKIAFDPTKRNPLSPEVAKAYSGRYYLKHDPNHVINVVVEDYNLVLVQIWDGKRIPLECITDGEFIHQEMAMPVTFDVKEDQGIIMHCFEADIWVKESKQT